MPNRTTFASRTRLLAAVLLAAACSDAVSPGRRGPGAPQFEAAAPPGIAFDEANGALGESGTALGQWFSPTNPHNGDAIVATFFWRGSTNIITSVTDRLADGTPVGNTYTLVEYVQAGGISMATYVATNVQNFPDPDADWSDLLEVQARLSAPVTDGGVVLSAYAGVNAASAAALGVHRSAIGSGGSQTTAGSGAISVNAGALVYGVTLSNDGVAGLIRPPDFATITTVSDAAMGAEAAYAVRVGAGSVNPQWTWFFDSPSAPRTWLATALALNPAAAPQPAVATRLAFIGQPSSTTAGAAISPPVQVAAQDDAGNTVATFTGSITVRTNPGPGTLAGTTTVAAVNGVASFSDLSIDQPGTAYTLVATTTATGVTGATSAAFNMAAPEPPVAAAAAGGITLDQHNSAPDERGTVLTKGFNPTNPHVGDAIVATFIWLGSTNIIDSVVDRLSNQTRVGNTYTLVQYIKADGISMATYVATNVQNFPDAGTDPNNLLVVQAFLSTPVADGGLVISAFTGVQADFLQALGASRSDSGKSTTQTQTVAHPGPITVNGGALAYGVTMSRPPTTVGMFPQAETFQRIEGTSDAAMAVEADFALPDATRQVDPMWTWFYDSQSSGCAPSTPCTWLATVLALNPAPVQPPPATHLVFTVQPTNTTAGSAISPAVRVAAQDDAGNTVASFGNTITIALGANPGGGTLSGTTTATPVNGVATFSNLSIDRPGNGYTLVATATGVTGATSAAFNITPRPATHLAFIVQPTNTTAGSTISPAVRVAAQDDAGNTVATFGNTITIALGANPGGGTLSGTRTVTPVNGVATFSNLSIDKAGNGYTLVATATGLTAATSAAFNIAAPPQARAQASGGGRIDPSIGKTTFGFNVDGRSGPPFQGEMQVVYHGGTSHMTRIHSLSIDGLTSSPDPRGGVCITWSGSARINNSDQRRFTATACDNGQPGSSPGKGPDRFGISVDGSVNTGLTDLTGGNTQARQ